MPTLRFILGCGLCASLLLTSCGKTPPPPGRDNKTLGDTPYGAPLGGSAVDTGILQDQTTYKPATFAGAPGAPGTPGAPGASAPDAQSAGKQVTTALLDNLRSGKLDLVLELFDPNQIKPIGDDNQFLFSTQQAYTALTRALARAAGDSAVEQLNDDLRKLVTDKLAVEVVSPDTVTVSPNPLLVVLGPQKASGPLTLVRKDAGWKVQLDAPLTDEDAEAIRAYHEKLQQAIYAIADALDAKTIDSSEAAYAALVKAGLGEEIDLTAATSQPGGETGEPTTAPTSAPTPGEPNAAPESQPSEPEPGP